MKTFFTSSLVIVLLFFFGCTKQSEKYTDFVNPFIGTDAHGHTFPGATLPFGMVQLSPDTRLDGWDGCSGYHYSDSIIYGFSHTHLSGTGCSDYGDILLMPTTGKLLLDNGSKNHKDGYCSQFKKSSEKASAGFYAVNLEDYNIDVELTTTSRVGFHKYSFPKTEDAHIILDLVHRDMVLDANINFLGNKEISGYRFSKAWADNQKLFFVIQFSQDFESFGIENNGEKFAELQTSTGTDLKAWVDFNTEKNSTILVKVGISAVSIENARKNLESEIPAWDFEKVKIDADKTWEKELSKIAVKDNSSDNKEIFYTALYHSFIAPNIYMDVSGEYRGRDFEIHTAKGWDNYTVFSLWDTYRATHPLLTIIDQKRTNDFINTFIHQYKQGGMLPVWELSACETGCMIGYHSVPVIADAYLKGITNYNEEEALEAMINSARQDHLGLDAYKELGYIPASREGESVSKTLEYAYDDWTIAQMAKKMGRDDIYQEFIVRAQNYKNLFDPSTGFMRARQDADWFSPFDPTEVNFNYTEANGWQYNFYVPQDINSHILLLGEENYESKLDEMFSASSETTGREQSDITGLIGQYAHGNEPSHHMAYLYNFVGKPWKGAKILREIMSELYTTKADGLCGNEDCGQMSSWYVFSAMGFYPVTPASNIYVIGSPIFEDVEIHLENKKTFSIKTENNSDKNIYIQSAKLNGKSLDRSYITHNEIMDGGVLEFVMGENPNKNWGSKVENRPTSIIVDNLIVPSPFVSEGENTFLGETKIDFGCIEDGATIYYSFDKNSDPEKWPVWEKPIVLNENTTVYAFAKKEGKKRSQIIETHFWRIPEGREIKLNCTYSSQYTAGGDLALIDCLHGGDNFKTGRWQGFYNQDFDAVVDLGKVRKVKKVSIGFVQEQGAWIFLPSEVKFFTSIDGKKFVERGVVKNPFPVKLDSAKAFDFKIENQNFEARFVKIVAKNMGKCPEWHLGAGGDTWLFADEIVVE